MTTKVQHTYAIGDRVAERPKAHGLVAVREETKHALLSTDHNAMERLLA
jgi:hypothetical protein